MVVECGVQIYIWNFYDKEKCSLVLLEIYLTYISIQVFNIYMIKAIYYSIVCYCQTLEVTTVPISKV